MGVARDPGNRAKIAVRSDDKVDPSALCRTARCARAQHLRELNGERGYCPLAGYPQYATQALSIRRYSVVVVSAPRACCDGRPDSRWPSDARANVRLTSKLLV